MTKLPLRTPDLSDKNYATLAALFPNAVTETIDENGNVVRAIDADVLAQEINTRVVSGKEERYQFTWPDKKRSVLVANSPIAATLRPCREESVDFDNTENLYIEGDNLDVLKLLRETYLNRVKMIYIDPPYNTGNDLIYEDDFAGDTGEFLARDYQYNDDGNRMVRNLDSNGRFHTDWLNMMYPRLKVARDLLTDDGVIFISCDEHEVHNLKTMCNNLFGHNNFVGTFIWRKKDGGGQAKEYFVIEHEYILVYRKSEMLAWMDLELFRDPSEYRKNDNKGNFKITKLAKWGNTARREDRPSMYFPLLAPDGTEVYPVAPDGNDGRWRIGKAKMQEISEEGLIHWEYKDEVWIPYEKEYFDNQTKIVKQRSILFDIANTGDGSNKLTELFSVKDIFENPKPLELIRVFLNCITKDDDTILDFFSGSATTAHAVMQLNAEDGGKRKFIMVQLPEVCAENSEAAKAGYRNICEIGKERIRRAGKRIDCLAESDGIDFPDIGFRVLKLDSSNMKDVYYTPQETVSESGSLQIELDGLIDNIKPDRTGEDLLFQVMLDLGVPLSSKIEKREIGGKTVFSVADNHLLACFNRVTDEIVTETAKSKPYYAVFRDSSFYNDATLVNFEQIFRTYSPTTVRKVL